MRYADLFQDDFAATHPPGEDLLVELWIDSYGICHADPSCDELTRVGNDKTSVVSLWALSLNEDSCERCTPQRSAVAAAHTLARFSQMPPYNASACCRRDASQRRPFVAAALADWIPAEDPTPAPTYTPGDPWVLALIERLEYVGGHPGSEGCDLFDRAYVRTDTPDHTIVALHIEDVDAAEGLAAPFDIAVIANTAAPSRELLDVAALLISDGCPVSNDTVHTAAAIIA